MKRYLLHLLVLVLFVGPLACDAGPATMPNPLVRLDVSSKLPPKVRRRLPSAIDLDCHDEVVLQAEGAKQTFIINWRVVDVDGARYMMAIDVQPSGTTSGAKSPKASGTIGQFKREGQGKSGVDSVSVVISWQAQKGCSQLKETKLLTVRSDHASCKSPQPGGLLKKPAHE
ncbi:MAG: hypothetical protein JRH20_22525 [Deltaproteobacteria bacterium]|nr:hypothetical protein [Deltaproteobacteria bacterium]